MKIRLNIEGIKDDWKKLPLEGYWMNSQGLLFSQQSQGRKQLLLPYLRSGAQEAFYYFYVGFKKKNPRRQIFVKDLFKQIWGEERSFNKSWYAWARGVINSAKMALTNKDTSFRRKCHDCGKPTNNYRCRECWQRIREQYRDNDVDPDLMVSLKIDRLPIRI